MNGKGDTQRPIPDRKTFDREYDRIFRKPGRCPAMHPGMNRQCVREEGHAGQHTVS